MAETAVSWNLDESSPAMHADFRAFSLECSIVKAMDQRENTEKITYNF